MVLPAPVGRDAERVAVGVRAQRGCARRRSSGGGEGASAGPHCAQARTAGGAGGRRAAAARRRVGCCGAAGAGGADWRAAHQLRRSRDGPASPRARISFLSSPLVSVPTSMRATNSSPSRSAKPAMRRAACACGRDVLVGDAARRVQHAADQAAAHVGPVRALGAVEPDQREDLAPRIGPLEHGELAVEIDGAGGAAAWRSRRSSPAPGRRSRRGGWSAAPWRACPWG